MTKRPDRQKIRYITTAGVIAAVYVALTGLSAVFGMASGTVQVRLSEALCVLPLFTSAAIPGVTLGCFLSNIVFGGTVWDIVFGTVATLIGLLLVRPFKKVPYLAFIPTVISNAAIIPFVLVMSASGGWNSFWFFSLTVGIGEIIACGILGNLLVFGMKKYRNGLFPDE